MAKCKTNAKNQKTIDLKVGTLYEISQFKYLQGKKFMKEKVATLGAHFSFLSKPLFSVTSSEHTAPSSSH